MLPFAIPYPPEQEKGFWGVPTSTIDWCEENYVVSNYIAEALNTLTNSVFILIALFFIYTSVKHKLDTRFLFTGFGFMLVGVGLWLFHMTLRYHYQLLDELPMIYATCIPCWSVFSAYQSKHRSWLIGTAVFFSANLLTVIYLHFKDPTIHQAAYGVLNVLIIMKSVQLLQRAIKSEEDRWKLYSTMIKGVILFLTGYVLWNMDIHFCDYARRTRRSWGMPYGFILEGHGWWHIFTGTGVYFYLVSVVYLNFFLLGTESFFELRTKLGFPYIVCVDKFGLQHYRDVQTLKKKDEQFLEKESKKQKND